MALGGGFLTLLLLPACLSQEFSLGEPDKDTLIAAPPHLTALIPAAATATVEAGYVSGNTAAGPQTNVALVTPEGISLVATVQSSAPPTPGTPSVLIVGDTRYHWQEWSQWHCNCAHGSMSRVRDISYSVPGVILDPNQYDVLRFQRVVCSYKTCHCKEHQCDQLEVTCSEEEHICALRDIEQDQHQKRKDFWARLHGQLKNLWMSIKEAFPQGHKESKAKSTVSPSPPNQ